MSNNVKYYWITCRDGLKGCIEMCDNRSVIEYVWAELGEEVVEYQPLTHPVYPILRGDAQYV